MNKRRSQYHILRLLVLSAIMACAMAVSAFAAETGVITGEVVNVRKGPGTGHELVEMLAKGKVVTILGEENGWYSPTEMELNLDVRSSSFNADSHLFKVEGVEVFLSRLN